MSEAAGQLSDELLRYLRDRLSDRSIELGSSLTPLLGGYDTAMYRFELDWASEGVPTSLVLRVYPPEHGTEKPLMESTVQNALALSGHPTASVPFVCTDASVLGGAFIVMEYLPGEPLLRAPEDVSPVVLGRAQADLHEVDPQIVIDALQERGIDNYRLDNRFAWLSDRADELPVIREGLDWLRQNRPPQPEIPALCHGDFHLLNVLFDGEKVTGIVDWSAFTIADPLFDVAGTLMLFGINGRRLAEAGELELRDVDRMIGRYLAAYRASRALDSTHLDYYMALRCLIALVHGLRAPGSRSPLIAQDLAERIECTTGIHIPTPH